MTTDSNATPATTTPWATASEIAARWESVTAARVNAVAKFLGLGPGSKHVRLPVFRDDTRNAYSDAARGLIDREFLSRGAREAAQP